MIINYNNYLIFKLLIASIRDGVLGFWGGAVEVVGPLDTARQRQQHRRGAGRLGGMKGLSTTPGEIECVPPSHLPRAFLISSLSAGRPAAKTSDARPADGDRQMATGGGADTARRHVLRAGRRSDVEVAVHIELPHEAGVIIMPEVPKPQIRHIPGVQDTVSMQCARARSRAYTRRMWGSVKLLDFCEKYSGGGFPTFF